MHTHHTIDYIEFSVKNIAEAKRFYNTVFGWKFTDYSPTYVGIQGPNNEIGGFSVAENPEQTTTNTKGAILVVLYSKDLQASREAIKQAGGVIIQDIFSFPGGKRFHFRDTNDNELAVWSDTSTDQ